ncbi:hypothetical protein J3Q64DRAFT_1830549 [Phycomyces blakesleeanus]|uniref:Uncharacterized protein n=2 Tax=Phycomyces blakesleeanus TaxID=4837 RepID=A0A163E525_PHYB8|nr:hypothetical protein PHYBLDRAFT_142205 [Phycomyces blakesleeanus NRRL 1555(-)]OAD76690.1 hypothetical protein PHYBLDRAFT_142205 [Phycomyces blakesleeanus NRRL 1555(-)]|eukprot:XP_018294730.1 hypothetical protein PHYBLDRAFT_142205 [Phycomyces blakesleeanus NRRL 1555(-)]
MDSPHSTNRGRAPPPPPRPSSSADQSRRTIPAPPPPVRNGAPSSPSMSHSMNSPHVRMSTIPVQSSFHSLDIEIPEPPLTEAGRWTFHSQRELPPPPAFEKKLRRYPTGAETGCSIPIDLSHLLAYN